MTLNNPFTNNLIISKAVLIPLIISFWAIENTTSEDTFIIDDFNTYEEDQFPSDWKGRKKKAQEEYRIFIDEDEKVLKAHSENS